MLKGWAEQRRRILLGRKVYRSGFERIDGRIRWIEGGEHVDGHPSISVAAVIRDGGRSGKVEQHFPEVYTGDGLSVWRALYGAPEQVRTVLHVHYVHVSTVREKYQLLHVERARYFEMLQHAEHYVGGRLMAAEGEELPAALLAPNAPKKARAAALDVSERQLLRYEEGGAVDGLVEGYRAGLATKTMSDRANAANHSAASA